jgi:hypothetical protein
MTSAAATAIKPTSRRKRRRFGARFVEALEGVSIFLEMGAERSSGRPGSGVCAFIADVRVLDGFRFAALAPFAGKVQG